MMIDTSGAGPLAVVLLAPPGQRDEQDVRMIGSGSDPARDLVSVNLRHPEVQQHGIGCERIEGRESSMAAVDDRHRGAKGSQERAQGLGRVAIVIHHENPPRWKRPELG